MMYVFQPLQRVQVFKETAPAQVRTGVWKLNYESFNNNILDELKKHAQEIPSCRGTPARNKKKDADELAVKKIKQEQILRYEQKKTKLLENTHLGDAYCTIFVAHIPVTASEGDVRKVFEKFGTVMKVTIIRQKKVKAGKTKTRRGYAFVVFQHKNEAKKVVSAASTIGGSRMLSIDGQRLIVDVERGRVVKNWLPNKLRK